MLNPKLDTLDEYTFFRLNDLLGDIKPKTNREPILLSIGEPQNQPPALLAETIAANADSWNRYPPPNGDEPFRLAVTDWLTRRYRLPDELVDSDKNVIPVPGTREPLFMLGVLAVGEEKSGQTPAVLIPNPHYHVYRGAAMVGRTEPVYLPARAETNFLPDLDAITPEILARAAILYICSPSNPQGTVAPLDYLKRAITLAREHDFLLAVDECYAEIYRGAEPPGALQACAELGGGLDNVVVLHSLSKRSSAAGMRSGFIAGDERLIARYTQLVTFGGSPQPLPILRAATALWRDEDHVVANRAHYARNFTAAQEILGPVMNYHNPEAGFFLWLDVGDGVAVAERLWREAAIKTLPGAFMAKEEADGTNPGARYLRVALVYEETRTREGLTRMVELL
ncbi:MAG: aminotransferase class I/II-fold pyridoxal phosphate-dependent enzyme [Rhodospirillaceae bacterium]|nr:aminotransferase class I/II-fold pyridoxal phosphate-dependent enzyme [Rhodospirillaceae bacterium]